MRVEKSIYPDSHKWFLLEEKEPANGNGIIFCTEQGVWQGDVKDGKIFDYLPPYELLADMDEVELWRPCTSFDY